MKKRILAVDPHPLTLNGYDDLLKTEPDLELAGIAQNPTTALRLAREKSPDAVVTEFYFEKGGGLQLIKHLNTNTPEIGILVVSYFDDLLFVSRSIEAGAKGFLHKSSGSDNVVEALRSILDGGLYLSPPLQKIAAGSLTGNKSTTDLDALTDRELEVFNKIAAGLTTREMAERLHISVKTVQTHRANIMDKLGIDTKEKLVRRAVIWSLESAR